MAAKKVRTDNNMAFNQTNASSEAGATGSAAQSTQQESAKDVVKEILAVLNVKNSTQIIKRDLLPTSASNGKKYKEPLFNMKPHELGRLRDLIKANKPSRAIDKLEKLIVMEQEQADRSKYGSDQAIGFNPMAIRRKDERKQVLNNAKLQDWVDEKNKEGKEPKMGNVDVNKINLDIIEQAIAFFNEERITPNLLKRGEQESTARLTKMQKLQLSGDDQKMRESVTVSNSKFSLPGNPNAKKFAASRVTKPKAPKKKPSGFASLAATIGYKGRARRG